MKRLWGVILITTLFTGCATFGQMEKGLKSLVGQDIRTAFDILGYADGKQEFGEDTVYIWTSSHTVTRLIPTKTRVTGTAGGAPMRGTAYIDQAVPVQHLCEIKLVTDKNGTITKYDGQGNLGGCKLYIARLNEYRQERATTPEPAKGGVGETAPPEPAPGQPGK